ncbi:elicitor-responsive protein 3-like [Rosa rugosa]|uniref:Putative C2 domain-containing protein n=1 Tax=Rosa chinensis TaxID=74649 RepID=A0A2P6P778_ROSCH|nr:elicitor-responsive protein 3 isoform X1 [Rosa chinensis]XP_061989064.1 elicitor-responsive protein 3-like [Rosa rugosa]PRQ17776.1 putative C2 domain-containing protein [Rosa chinensis]
MAPRGVLDVSVIGGRNLKNPDKVGKVMVIVNYKDQEHRTQPVVCHGTDPEWNEQLLFTIADSVEDVRLRVHDGDYVTDEEVGHSSIPLNTLLESGYEAQIEAHPYDVSRGGDTYGEIIVALHFHPEPGHDKDQD